MGISIGGRCACVAAFLLWSTLFDAVRDFIVLVPWPLVALVPVSLVPSLSIPYSLFPTPYSLSFIPSFAIAEFARAA